MIYTYTPAINYFPDNMTDFTWSKDMPTNIVSYNSNALYFNSTSTNKLGYYYCDNIVGSNLSDIFMQFRLKVTSGEFMMEISTGTGKFLVGIEPKRMMFYPTSTSNGEAMSQRFDNAYQTIKINADDTGTGKINIYLNGNSWYSYSPMKGYMTSINRIAFGKTIASNPVKAYVTNITWEVYKTVQFASKLF